MLIRTFLTVCVFIVTADFALAGGYFGALRGTSKLGIDGYDVATSYKFYGGARKKFVAIEWSYTNFGDFKVSGVPIAKLKGTAFSIAAVGYLPIYKQFELFGKIGVSNWYGTGEINGVTLLSESDNTSIYSFGAQYTFLKHYTVRFESQKFDDILDTNVKSTFLGIAFNY